LPENELCDNQDHNCNGVLNDIDGGCVCAANQTQSCYTGPAGTQGLGTCHGGTQSCLLDGGVGGWGPCTGEVTPVQGDCDHASCTGPNNPNPGCACINTRTQSCYTGPANTLGVGICVAGSQTCAGGQWGTCTGQTLPQAQDDCVAPGTAYNSTTQVHDKNCNNLFDRVNPVARPTASATGATALVPLPAGYYSGIVVSPLSTVTFSPGISGVSYAWRLISAPSGNSAGLSGAPGASPTDISTQQTPSLFAQLVGDYVVGLRVTAASGANAGCQSAEAIVGVHVKPSQRLLVQLTWGTSVDMDLQVVQGSTSSIFSTGACYWGNKATTWGASLDIDDLAGCNSENITLPNPAPEGSTYAVYVTYYCNHRGHRWTDPLASPPNDQFVCYEPGANSSAVPVTVNVYADGNLAATYTHSMPVPNYTGWVAGADNFSWSWWKPATLTFTTAGGWAVAAAGQTGLTDLGCGPGDYDANSNCLCGSTTAPAPNCGDPFCGTIGAGCREKYSYTHAPPLCF
jgi:hypothetical protein